MKRWVSLALAVAILAVIYTRIDIYRLLDVLQQCSAIWLTAGLGLLLPVFFLIIARFLMLMPPGSRMRMLEACRLILAAGVLNMVLPSKMGDIAKAYFMRERGHLPGASALALVVFEKVCDLLSLSAWCTFGLVYVALEKRAFWAPCILLGAGTILGILATTSSRIAEIAFAFAGTILWGSARTGLCAFRDAWKTMQRHLGENRQRAWTVAGVSLVIWLLHLVQIWFFIIALGARPPLGDSMALSALAIFVGLLPITFAGIGTRDAALMFFFSDHLSPAAGAALGLLCTSRYVLPAICGLPFAGEYLAHGSLRLGKRLSALVRRDESAEPPGRRSGDKESGDE